jgi:hypothetical protein
VGEQGAYRWMGVHELEGLPLHGAHRKVCAKLAGSG